ncbi:MAG: methyltransferase domain-containing protein [Nitrososphaerota archaeon]
MVNLKSRYKYEFRKAWAWPEPVEKFIASLLVSPSLHVCCGESTLGDVRVDIKTKADIQADAFHLPFRDEVFASVVSDPPWHMSYNLRPKFAKEIYRVLRPGGIFILNSPWALGLTHTMRLEAVYYALPSSWRNCPLIILYRKTQNTLPSPSSPHSISTNSL